MAGLFGSTPEELRKAARTDFLNRKKQMLSTMQGGSGLAGQLSRLGQAAGMALGGIGTEPDLDTPEIRQAEKRQKVLSGIFKKDKTPTADSMLTGMKSMMEDGDIQGAMGFFKLYAQMGTVEAAKRKADKPPKRVFRDVTTPEGKVTSEIVDGVAIPIGDPVKPTTKIPKITKGDREATLTQAKSVYKDMDFSGEYTAAKHDPFLDLVTNEVARRSEELRAKGEPVSRAKLTREVLNHAKKSGAIREDTTLGFSEPIIDPKKMDIMFGVKKKEETVTGLTDKQKKRLKELRAKQ